MKTFIEILKDIVVKLGGTTKNNSSEFGVIKAIEEAVGAFATNTQNSINGLVEDVTAVEDRVTALEEGGSGGGTERPVITLIGTEGTTDGHGVRTIPIDMSQIDYNNPPIINIIGYGSLIPTKADFMETPIIQYSNFSRANGSDLGDRHTFIWQDVSAEQSADMPGVILDLESGFNVIIKTITHVYVEG